MAVALPLTKPAPTTAPRFLEATDPGGRGIIRQDGPPFTAYSWPKHLPIPNRWHEPPDLQAAITRRGSAALLALELTIAPSDAQRLAAGPVSPRPPRAPRVARASRAPRPRRSARFPRRPRRPRIPRLARWPPREPAKPAAAPAEELQQGCGYAFDMKGRLAVKLVLGETTRANMQKWADSYNRPDIPQQIGLMGALTRRTGERYKAYFTMQKKGDPCPDIATNPCADWLRPLIEGARLVTKWTGPEIPEEPAFAAKPKPPQAVKPRRRRGVPVTGFEPVSPKRCAFLLREQRFAEARGGCPAGLRFTVTTDLGPAPVPRGGRAPESLGDLDIEGVITVIEGLDQRPGRIVTRIDAQE